MFSLQGHFKPINVFEIFGNLQQGQLVNSEEFQTLSKAITHITSVMSQFQTFMDKHNVQGPVV